MRITDGNVANTFEEINSSVTYRTSTKVRVGITSRKMVHTFSSGTMKDRNIAQMQWAKASGLTTDGNLHKLEWKVVNSSIVPG